MRRYLASRPVRAMVLMAVLPFCCGFRREGEMGGLRFSAPGIPWRPVRPGSGLFAGCSCGVCAPMSVIPHQRWGALLLHAGLLLLIAAGLWAYAFEVRGFLQLMEGETFSGSEPELLLVEKGRLAGSFNAPFCLTLKNLAHDYWENGEPRDFASLLLVEDKDGAREERLAINSPLYLSGFSVFQSPHYGYSVTVGFSPAGKEVFTHFLLDRPEKPGPPATGGSDFPPRITR